MTDHKNIIEKKIHNVKRKLKIAHFPQFEWKQVHDSPRVVTEFIKVDYT